MAREFSWLAIRQSRASPEGSHHRLDHCEHVKRNQPSFLFDRAARDSNNGRHRPGLLSNKRNVGEQRRHRSQDRHTADHAHVDPNARHMANHRWNVLARECNWPVTRELIRFKKKRPGRIATWPFGPDGPQQIAGYRRLFSVALFLWWWHHLFVLCASPKSQCRNQNGHDHDHFQKFQSISPPFAAGCSGLFRQGTRGKQCFS
jgi:hypothetical protein